MDQDPHPGTVSQNSLAMDTGCQCKKSKKDVRGTKSAATSTAPIFQDATTSMHGFEELQQSKDKPKEKAPPRSMTFHTLDEFLNMLSCETEESERLFIIQAKEMLRNDIALINQKEKIIKLNVLMQSATTVIESCERNLLYINNAQSLMDCCLLPLLELYQMDTSALPGDERGSLYNQLMSIMLLRAEIMIASEDLIEISAGQNEDDDVDATKLQIIRILNYHYQVLCTTLSKIEEIEQTIKEIQEGYRLFFEKHPCVLCCNIDKRQH